MTSVHDVAAAVLARTGRTSTTNLQELVYYAKAWHAVWEDRELFPEGTGAWVGGPACPALYEVCKGDFAVSCWPSGDQGNLSQAELKTINAVVSRYGRMGAHALSALARHEAPWRDARRGLAADEQGHEEITLASMVEYYSAIEDEESSVVVR